MNAALREQLPAGAYFLDLSEVSGIAGRATFYDMRNYYWTKQPFGEEGVSFTRRAPLGRGQGTELRGQKGHRA